MRQRYLRDTIELESIQSKKMAFISGPRQVGKSTLAKEFLSNSTNYFLFDEDKFKRLWVKDPTDSLAQRAKGPVVLDEIHKDRLWKRRLKGVWDSNPGLFPIIVTGSARLDLYRRGGDSLLGRYLPFRLHPFSVAETRNPPAPSEINKNINVSFRWHDLMQLGGFPEPLLDGSEAKANRWSRLRLDRLVLEDSRDILNISDTNAFRILIDLLPDKVGGLFSINSLQEDVGRAFGTVKTWISVLESLYYCFLIRPYSKRIVRSLRAEPKLFLFDILRIPKAETARRLENLAALHLLKACNFWTDAAYGDFDLHYLRDKEKREVDFCITQDGKPWCLVECKTSETEPSTSLKYYTHLLKPALSFQLVDKHDFIRDYPAFNIQVIDYERFFSGWV